MLLKEFWQEFFNGFCDVCKELYKKKGFNYDLPSEAQIGAEFYHFIRNKNYPAELESNIFNKDSGKDAGRYDVRIIGNTFDFIIEIKRAWALNIWGGNTPNEHLKSWKRDIQKLSWLNTKEYDKRFINEETRKFFILVPFWDSEIKYNKLKETINSFDKQLKEKFEVIDLIEIEPQKIYDKNIKMLAYEKEDIFSNLFVWILK